MFIILQGRWQTLMFHGHACLVALWCTYGLCMIFFNRLIMNKEIIPDSFCCMMTYLFNFKLAHSQTLPCSKSGEKTWSLFIALANPKYSSHQCKNALNIEVDSSHYNVAIMSFQGYFIIYHETHEFWLVSFIPTKSSHSHLKVYLSMKII